MENNLIDSNAASVEKLKSLFSEYVKKAKEDKKTESSSSSKGSSGKGSSGKTSAVKGTFSNNYVETKKEEVKEDKKEELPTEKVITFNDIENHGWAKDAIAMLVEKNVINGKSENEFCPDDFISRKEIAKIIALAFGFEKTSNSLSFNDVAETEWSAPYIAAVAENGIITGVDEDSFMPDGIVTREMLATVLYRVIIKSGVSATASGSTFDDESMIADYAKKAVELLSGLGIVNGNGDGNFYPKKNCTRAEAVTMIYRAMQLNGKE